MSTQREQITAIRDLVEKASHGDEPSGQLLYHHGFGSLSKEQWEGLLIGLNFTLAQVCFAEEVEVH